MIIAFASTDGILINEHFGWSQRFDLYHVEANHAEFIRSVEAPDDPNDNEAEKLSSKIAAIEGSRILYCAQIGPKASTMVLASKIHPIRSTGRIDEAITQLQEMWLTQPPMWLLRLIHT